jgi:signal peptidase I
MATKRSRKIPGPLAAFLIVVMALTWILFAPRQLGGQASYVIINGNSMVPQYHSGDLVILRQSDRAEVGDIFAYLYPELGAVIHRIVAVDGDHFTFKGDNNSWLDGYHPTSAELIGKAWLHVPGVGAAVIWLRRPLPLALFAGMIGGLLMFGFVFDSSKQPDGKRRWSLGRLKFPRLPRLPRLPKLPRFPEFPRFPGFPRLSRWIGESREGILFALSLLLFAAGALGIFAFTAPAYVDADDNIDYSHTTRFTYSAPANWQVYDNAAIQSGDPVFPQLNCSLDVTLDYAIASAAPLDVRGTYRILATVSESNGWRRTLELLPAKPFEGGVFHDTVTMNVCAIRKMIDDVVALTGLTRSTYAVSVVAEVDQAGKIGDRAYQERITPALRFALDSVQLYLVRDETSEADPLKWKQAGIIPGKRSEANVLSILGLKLPVLTARVISAIGLLVSVAGLVALGLPAYREARRDELAAIRLKYAPMLVEIGGQQPAHPASDSGRMIDVKSMEGLARLAQDSGTVILEQVVEEDHHFLVFLAPFTYRYVMHRVKENDADVL